MASARAPLPESPLRSGLKHSGLALLAFGGVTLAGLAFIQFGGAPEPEGPQAKIALFSTETQAPPSLKVRFDPDAGPQDSLDSEDGISSSDDEIFEPSLGIADPGDAEAAARVTVTSGQGTGAATRRASPLPVSPVSGLYEEGANGMLPRIAEDGRTPFGVYRRAFSNPAGRPTISVVLGGLGLNTRVTQTAIDDLPPEVTLSFVPYAKNLQQWVDKARAAGHEVLLELPMEPYDYPNNDTGPYTLLTTSDESENRRRLDWLLSQATGYFGVANYQGAKYATDARAVSPLFDALSERGLSFIHDGSAPRSVFGAVAATADLPFAEAGRVIDSDPSPAAIDEQLLYLEAIALQRGHALGSGFGFPVTVQQIGDWTATLEEKGYVLAPASSLPRTASGIR